ncbi:hypothetical protein ZWY2020_009078 [Hordeum vulgare]|nr:hypothetical protein ZWY2020_009078 [Hordeum vulgare]
MRPYIHEMCIRAARPDEAGAKTAVRHDADGGRVHGEPVPRVQRRIPTGVAHGAAPPTPCSPRHSRVQTMMGRHVRGARVGLSDHHVIDLLHDKRTHCFPGVIVGTRFHDILAVEPARTRDNQTFVDFHDFPLGAYKDDNSTSEPQQPLPQPCRPTKIGLLAQGEPVIKKRRWRVWRVDGVRCIILKTAQRIFGVGVRGGERV